MAKAFLFPIYLYQNEIVTSLNLCEGGFFRRIVEKYWFDGKAFPPTDYALMKSIGGDLKTWKRYKDKVDKALDVMMPLFIEERDKRAHTRIRFQNNAYIMRTKLKSKGQGKRTHFSDEKETHIEVNTIAPPPTPFLPGRHDPIARKQALKSTKDKPQTTFTDD